MIHDIIVAPDKALCCDCRQQFAACITTSPFCRATRYSRRQDRIGWSDEAAIKALPSLIREDARTARGFQRSSLMMKVCCGTDPTTNRSRAVAEPGSSARQLGGQYIDFHDLRRGGTNRPLPSAPGLPQTDVHRGQLHRKASKMPNVLHSAAARTTRSQALTSARPPSRNASTLLLAGFCF